MSLQVAGARFGDRGYRLTVARVAAIFALALLVRLAPLNRYVTPDEPIWVQRSVAFADAVAARDWAAKWTLLASLLLPWALVAPLPLYYADPLVGGPWVAGQVVVDTHALALPADAPAGEYTVFAGLYDAKRGPRVPLYGANGAPIPDGRAPVQMLVVSY